ncbi:MAG TPA: cupin domain-containing protein [Candidatus Dormibacteraeota bacterium]|nr:cupin domain-containing protein [Candidatus Dormibacteraeota bacterium]
MKTIAALFIAAGILAFPTLASAGTLSFVCHDVLLPAPVPGDKDGDQVFISDLTMVPGYTARLHSHSAREYLVVERGTATVTVKGQAAKTVRAGSAIVIPANAPHTIANLTKMDGLELLSFKVGSAKQPYTNMDKRPRVPCSKP